MNPHEMLRHIRYVLAGGIICGAIVYAIVGDGWYDPFSLRLAFTYSFLYTALMWTAQATSFAMLERYHAMRTKRDVLVRVLVHGVVIVLSFIVATSILRAIWNPGFLASRGTMAIIALVALSASVVGNGIYYLDVLSARMRRAERAALEAELASLRAQINPHFLFNSLNSIAALIAIDPARAEALIESLADLFRYTLRTSEQPAVTLGEDLAATELYLEIERARFGERLGIVIDIPDALARIHVPSMMLQPLVENAIKHGASAMRGRCDVTIRAALDGPDLVIAVSDTGPGFDTADMAELTGRGKGLGNVRDRLRHMFGERCGIAPAAGGVEIRIPHGTAPSVRARREERA